jgi:DNA-binding beta-propeller fold protein YncE
MRCAVALAAALAGFALSLPGDALAVESAPLVLESKISLGNIRGRIDHFAMDSRRQRLFVAELGNDTVGVIDLKRAALMRTLTGFSEPQGIAYVPKTDAIYVANGGDGSVCVLRGGDFTLVATIELGSDADNVRVDDESRLVYVGYGAGALAVIDPSSQRKIASISLKAHPESFRIESRGSRILINVPGNGEIAVVDRAQRKQVASWPTQGLSANFPLMLDENRGQALVVFRSPPTLAVLSLKDGSVMQRLETCADADDVFVDAIRQRLYVSCGEGFIDSFAWHEASYQRLDKVPTAAGARTSYFDPTLDRLYVAVRAVGATPAAIWIYKPVR